MADEITHPALAPVAENGNGHDPPEPSTLDWLRTRHEQLSADRTTDYEVPGYGGRLVLRCGPVPWKAIGHARQLAVAPDDDDGEALLAFNCDVVIGATRAVLAVDDDGQLVSIDADNPEPVVIGKRLAELLRTGTTTARSTCRWLFPSELGIAAAAADLLQWTEQGKVEDAETLASE